MSLESTQTKNMVGVVGVSNDSPIWEFYSAEARTEAEAGACLIFGSEERHGEMLRCSLLAICASS